MPFPESVPPKFKIETSPYIFNCFRASSKGGWVWYDIGGLEVPTREVWL
jgi:hypothetical protein